MEVLGLVDIPWWLLLALGFCILLYIYGARKHSVFKRYNIPGPKSLPYIGSMGMFFKKGVTGTDEELVKKYGRVLGMYMGNYPSMLISDPEMAKQICVKESANFQNRPQLIKPNKFFAGAVSLAEGEHWKFLRATISPAFSTGKIKAMVPLVAKGVDRLVENIRAQSKDGSAVEMKAIFGAYTMDTIASTSFGIDVDSQKDPDNPYVVKAKKAMNFSLFNPFFIFAIWFPDLSHIFKWITITPKDVIEFFRTATKQAMEERRQSPNDSKFKDFLQLMLDSKKEEAPESKEELTDYAGYKERGITDDEILANALVFFIAGYETTSTALTWVVYCLATNLDVQDRLLDEIDQTIGKTSPTYEQVFSLQYLDMVFSETLRLYPPATRFNRLTENEMEVCGWKIPKGMDINFPIFAMHRCADFFPDPEKFDPERFSPERKHEINPYVYMPFGVGPRNCVGMRLALLKAKLALVVLLQNFRFVTCDKTEIPPVLHKGGFVKPANGMFLKVEERA